MFADVMTGLEELADELADAKSQAKLDQVQLIEKTDQYLSESLALAIKESEERDRRLTREIERLLNNHDNTQVQMMTNLEKRLPLRLIL